MARSPFAERLVRHFMREIMKSRCRGTLFMKIGYDLPNSPPHYLLPHLSVHLEFDRNVAISELYFGSVDGRHQARLVSLLEALIHFYLLNRGNNERKHQIHH